MEASNHSLAVLLTLAGLIGATIEYVEIVRRRVTARRASVERWTLEESGLRGLVRLFAVTDGSRNRE